MLNLDRVYPTLTKYFFDMADQMLTRVSTLNTTAAPSSDSAFLLAYLDEYDHFLSAALLLAHTFGVFDRIWLKRHRDEWFARAPDEEDLPPGMELGDPPDAAHSVVPSSNRDGDIVLGVPGQPQEEGRGARVPVPKKRGVMDEEIMRWESATAAGAPETEELAKILFPPDGKPIFGEACADESAYAREKAQCEARRYSSLPANVYMQLVPTLLRLWRLASIKHLSSDQETSLARVVHRTKEMGELEQEGIARRLGRCFWAIGVGEQDLGFGDVVEALRFSN